jgi:hypothetical protein
MPGDHENVMKLNADHSKVCKFGSTLEDQDNFKLVQGNIKDLYKNALKIGELSIISPANGREQKVKHVNNDKELYTRFAKLKIVFEDEYLSGYQTYTTPGFPRCYS